MRKLTLLSTLTPAMTWAMATLVAASGAPAFAAASPGGDFDYPELTVTPRASERLLTEAGREGASRWVSEPPIQFSALSTLVAGSAQLANPNPSKDPGGTTGIAGVVVGGAWLATTLALEAFAPPYASAAHEISALPAKTQREQLVRERYAEEAIHARARLEERLKWLSLLTNLGANAYMASQANSGAFSMWMDCAAAAFAFAPLIFRSHAEDVSDEQDSYKKRIYAPLATATILKEPVTGQPAPGLALALLF